MLDAQKTLEREALLRRLREIETELAQIERNIREVEARLPLEEQLRLKLRRFIEANIPELAGKIDITWRLRNRRFSLWLPACSYLYFTLDYCFQVLVGMQS